jgi:small-conductance mechanosensitive channel
LQQLREVLAEDAKVEKSTGRVRVVRFGENAIEVELYVYILERDYSAFLAAQENLLLQVMETLERTGGAVALPSQTTMVTQDAWVDPDKAAAARAAMGKSGEAGESGGTRADVMPHGRANKP